MTWMEHLIRKPLAELEPYKPGKPVGEVQREYGLREIIRLCAELGAPVTIGSDAHIAQGVGEFEVALRELEAYGMRWEQIVNRELETVLAFLGLDH